MSKNCWALLFAGLLLGGWFSSAPQAAAADAPFADSPYIIDSWETGPGENELPQSSVISIVQNREGYLWLATLNGLVRFDGIRFTVFDESNLPALDTRRIIHLFEDSRGNLWVGTDGGGIVLLRKDGSTEKLNIGTGAGAGSLRFASEDSSGTVWLNTTDGQIARYQNNRLEILPVRGRPAVVEKSGLLWAGVGGQLLGASPISNSPAFLVEQEIPVRTVDFLLASRTGGCWRMTDGRVQKWNNGRLEHDWGPYPWGHAFVWSACEDHQGNLIVGVQDAGVYWYDGEGRATVIGSKQGLSHNTALSLCMDREGALWVGTDGGGLDRVRRKSFRVVAGSEGLTIQSVCEGTQGGFMFAFLNNLSHWTNGVQKQYQLQRAQDPVIRSLLADREGKIWAGTRADGLFVLHPETGSFEQIPGSENSGPISVMYQDRTNRLWVGAERGLICLDRQATNVYTSRDGLSADDVRAIAEDTQGNLWIGTQSGGLNCLRDGKFTAFRKSTGGLPSDNVYALLSEPDGVLWIGTSGGLARLQNGKWTRYATREGLANSGGGCLIDDGQNSLWIGSYRGLMRVSKKSLNDLAAGLTNSVICRFYGKSDGLPTAECTQGSQPTACRTSDGRLWFATIQGLVSVDPSDLKPNPFQPPVVIESVLVEGQKQNTNVLFGGPIESIVIPPRKEQLEIHYTSLNLGAADRARFKYRLAEHETTWTDAGNTRVAHYNKLPPGRYQFHVIAGNEDGIWSETGSTLAIVVQPPFWREWWFVCLTAACVVGLIAGTVYLLSTQRLQRELAVLKQQEELEKERARIARDLHDQLGANLMQVVLLGELAETDKHLPDEVESHARQIYDTARETTKALDEIVWAVNPSNDTLEGLITYICKYAQEYFEIAGLRYRLDVPTQLPDVTIPPEVRHNVFLAAKEAINNVVKHARASAAWLRLKLEPDRFILEIEDDGRGLAGMDEKTGRNGLRNMRKRLEDVGGGFSIGPASENGAIVRLTAPIGKN